MGDARGEAWALLIKADVAAYSGDLAAADVILARSLALFRAVGDATHEAMEIGDMGRYARWRGDHAAARPLLEEALALTRRVGNEWSLVVILAELALLAQDEDDDERAAGPSREALGLLRVLGTRWNLPECLELAACAASRRGQYRRAARLFGAAETVRDATGLPPQPGDRAGIARQAAAGRAALGEAAFVAAWGEGRRLPLERAIEEALTEQPDDRSPAAAAKVAPQLPSGTSSLTPREREVAALVARGLSNRQVGEALVITERTAEGHVGNILAKLGLASRAQLVAWALRRELATPPD